MKDEAPSVPEEMEEEAVGITGSSKIMDGKRCSVPEEADSQTSSCMEDNNRSGLPFITVESDNILPPKSEAKGSDGQLLAQFKIYSLIPFSHQ